MPPLFWTGKLTPLMKVLANCNNLLAWLTGDARDAKTMKERMKLGYEGAVSDDVKRYDELGLEIQTKSGIAQLEGVDASGMEVLDVGCGTGVLSFLLLERGAKKVVCGDISEYMLDQARAKAAQKGYEENRIGFRQLDAEALPFEDNRFDFAITGMTSGLLPDLGKAISEMARVTRPGGLVGVGAHGYEHYWEPVDACFRAVTKRLILGYRLEYWPRKEKSVRKLMRKAGLTDIQTKRFLWRNNFRAGGEAYDFFAAISSAWWYANFPPAKVARESEKARRYFERKNVTQITDDVIIAYGRKP
jgi:ubiquinone/menaquinone biosynthesis C-methylase UbiE